MFMFIIISHNPSAEACVVQKSAQDPLLGRSATSVLETWRYEDVKKADGQKKKVFFPPKVPHALVECAVMVPEGICRVVHVISCSRLHASRCVCCPRRHVQASVLRHPLLGYLHLSKCDKLTLEIAGL